MVDLKLLESERYLSDSAAIKAVLTADRAPLKDTENQQDIKLNPYTNVIFERKKKEYIKLKRETDPEYEMSKRDERKLKKEIVKHLWRDREVFEKKFSSRIDEGIMQNLRTYKMHLAADMAWDSSPIIPEQIPLNLYAQGKINFQTATDELLTLQSKIAERGGLKFIDIEKKEDGTHSIKQLNIPRLYEVIFNIVRPYITRRLAGQTAKYLQRDVHLEYISRKRTLPGKLQAEAMSQRAEIMWDQYGYGHNLTQQIRDALLYTHVITFVASAWNRAEQLRLNESEEVETVVEREGVEFITPHPTRTFYDIAYPLSTLNTDTGVEYVGFWDIVRLADIVADPDYFNRDQIYYCDTVSTLWEKHPMFIQYYYQNICTIKPPMPTESGYFLGNDRLANVALYNTKKNDAPVMVAHYFEKVIPKDVGMGNYPHPVWLRLTVINEKTAVYGEFLPSSPGMYLGINENDNKLASISMAHEIIPYQDQIQQMLGQMTYLMKIQSILVFMINMDILNEEERIKLSKMLEGKNYYSQVIPLEFSFTTLKETLLAGNSREALKAFEVVTVQMGAQINELLIGIGTLTKMLEKNLMMSQQELGQVVGSGESTATENLYIQESTTALYNFISQGVDEFLAAMKRIIYESTVVLGSDEIELPVVENYPDNVISAAGFQKGGALMERGKQTVIGSKKALVHDFLYDTRSGASEGQRNVESAKVLMQLLTMLMNSELLVQKLGEEQLFAAISEVFRKSGSDFVIKIPLDAGPFGQPDQAMMQQLVQTIMQAIEQRVKPLENGLVEITNEVTSIVQGLNTVGGGANTVQQAPAPRPAPMQQMSPSPQQPMRQRLPIYG